MSRASRASSSAGSTARSTRSSTTRSPRPTIPPRRRGSSALKGKVAIANAKLAYQDYKRLFSGARWDKLAAKGAKPQRLLWASTGTKNKAYSDVLYVEELIGPNTVNTVPPATLDAFRDHGKPRDSLEENIDDARRVLAELEKSGISLDAITDELVKEGVKLFADAADKLSARSRTSAPPCSAAASTGQQLALGDGISKAVEKSTEEWRAARKIRRLWEHDESVWTGDDEDKWLGWLDSPAAADVADYEDFARRVKGQNFTDAVVLGMGGSSLGPEVLAETFAQEVRLPEAARARLHRSRAGARDGGRGRSRRHAVHRLQQVRRHHRAERDEGLFLRPRRPGPSARTRPGTASSRSPIPARRWRRSRPSRALRASSTAIRPSAGATRCCRRSAWCRRPPPASTFAACSRTRSRWCAPAAPTCRRTRTPACSSGSRWVSPASKAATR